jgi:hypothetical protein
LHRALLAFHRGAKRIEAGQISRVEAHFRSPAELHRVQRAARAAGERERGFPAVDCTIERGAEILPGVEVAILQSGRRETLHNRLHERQVMRRQR